MLSEKEIRELNDRMLGLGVPVEKDDVGYNRPDWIKMEIFGRYIGKYTDWQLMTMLEALSHYTNTQLSEYKDEITESLRELKAKEPEYSPLTAKPGPDFIPVGVYLDEIQKSGASSLSECTIHLHIPTTDFSVIDTCNAVSRQAFVDGRGGYRCRATREDSVIQIYVKPDCYVELMKELATTGAYGYKPKDFNEKKLLEFVEKATATQTPSHESAPTEIEAKPVKLVKTEISGVVIYFDGYVNDVNLLKNSVEGLRSLKLKDKWHTFVPFNGADKVCAALVKNGYQNVLPQIEAEAKKMDEQIKNWNGSGKTLADLSKFDLPFTPYPFQVEDASNLVTKKRMLIGHDMGCVSGQSKVRIKGEGQIRSKSVSVENLFRLIKEDPSIQIKALVNGFFAFMPVKAVIDKGVRDTLCIETTEGYLECTPDHEIYTNKGWVEAGKLVPGDTVLASGMQSRCEEYALTEKHADVTTNRAVKRDLKITSVLRELKIVDIHPAFLQRVYDIAINDPEIHNFVCNDIVVHNCGKTFIAGLVGYSIPGKKLVIVPESLRLNWQREMKAINKSADVVVLRNEDIKKKGLTFGDDWTIIGYSTAVKYCEDILKQEYSCVFIDEAHRCKAVNNSGKPTSKRAEAVLDICAKAEHCYPMTGTPIPTSNKDIFNLFKILKVPEIDHGQYSSFFQFGLRFCNGYNNGFGYDFTGSSHSEELNQLLGKNMVRRLKKDVLPNLKKQRVFIPVEIKSKEYDDIEKRLQAAANGNGLPGDTFLGLAMTGRAIMSAKKVESSIDLADSILDSGKSVVIVSEFNDTLDKIVEHYKGDCCCIRGGMSDKAKQDAVDSFQSGKCHVCALNTIAGGVGITLTKASDMIVCDYDWTPANMDQVEDRINRSGQKEDCSMIHYLYNEKSTLDTLFMDMITKKSENINRVVDNAENTMKFVKDRESAQDFIQLLKKVYRDRTAHPQKTEPEETERE